MRVETLLTGLAGLIVAASGVYLAVHGTRRRERRITRREIDDLTAEVHHLLAEQHALRALLLEQRRYIYRLVTLMIDAGLDPPQPPAPTFDVGEYDAD